MSNEKVKAYDCVIMDVYDRFVAMTLTSEHLVAVIGRSYNRSHFHSLQGASIEANALSCIRC